MSAFFTDAEKLDAVRVLAAKAEGRITADAVAVIEVDQTQVEILKAVRDDYETKLVVHDTFTEGIEKIVSPVREHDGFDAVVSSNVAAMRHVPEHGVMEVRFINGRAYRYFGVDRGLYNDVKAAASVGAALDKRVIKGGYRSDPMENWK